MTIYCPHCKAHKLEEVSQFEPLVCEACGYEYKLVATGKIYAEGE